MRSSDSSIPTVPSPQRVPALLHRFDLARLQVGGEALGPGVHQAVVEVDTVAPGREAVPAGMDCTKCSFL